MAFYLEALPKPVPVFPSFCTSLGGNKRLQSYSEILAGWGAGDSYLRVNLGLSVCPITVPWESYLVNC